MSASLVRERPDHRLYCELRTAIESGRATPGDRLASTRALQRQFGLSYHATVKALDRLRQEGWVVRRNGSGTFVSPALPAAPSLRMGGRLRLIRQSRGAHVDVFLSGLLGGIREAAEAHGASLRETAGDPDDADQPATEAIIWANPNPAWKAAGGLRRPLVLVAQDCDMVLPWDRGYDVISADSLQGGALAADYVRGRGFRRVAFVGVGGEGPGGWESVSYQRLRGFAVGLGKPLTDDMLFRISHYTTTAGARVIGEIWASSVRPDAVFAASDDIALGMAHGALALGIPIGRDLSIIGFDGQPPRHPAEPRLTTVAVPLAEMGRLAVRLALERTRNPDAPMRRIGLACSLRKGETA